LLEDMQNTFDNNFRHSYGTQEAKAN